MKKNDKNAKNGKEFSKDREFAVVLERIHTDIKAIAEGQRALKDKFDMLYEEFGKQKEAIFITKADIRIMKADIAILKSDVAVLKADVAEIKTDVKGHTNRIAHLEEVK